MKKRDPVIEMMKLAFLSLDQYRRELFIHWSITEHSVKTYAEAFETKSMQGEVQGAK
jgi:hypothetical protein